MPLFIVLEILDWGLYKFLFHKLLTLKKHTMLRVLFIVPFLLSSCSEKGDYAINAAIAKTQAAAKIAAAELPVDSLLVGIQDKINQAFVQSLISHKNDALVSLGNRLSDLAKTKKQNLIIYWQSYLKYHTAIFYLEGNNKKASEQEVTNAINLLKKVQDKNSEDYALLALMQAFSIQFKTNEAVFISTGLNDNLKQSFAQDPDNIRACYVFASNDFYTPAKYGGGKQAQKYLLKAIALPAQKIKNSYLPSWGKEESYELLIRTYIQQKKIALAKKYYEEGLKQFPDSYIIKQLAPKLADK